MMATYRSLLRKIARRPADVFRRRIRLGNLEKLQLVARWSLNKGGRRKADGGMIGQPLRVPPSPFFFPPSIAIVGGGLAGLAAAVAAV